MTANVKILVDQRPNVLRVLNAALRYHPPSQTSPPASVGKPGGKGAAPEQAVWILDADNKPQRVVVTTGETDGTYTEVTGGAEGRRPRDCRSAGESNPGFHQSQPSGQRTESISEWRIEVTTNP